MWSSFHAARSDTVGQPEKSIEALLPLFHSKSATPEMIHHGMKIVKETTSHLNPCQIPVLVVDQPLYDLAKKYNGHFQKHMGKISCNARWSTYRNGIVEHNGGSSTWIRMA